MNDRKLFIQDIIAKGRYGESGEPMWLFPDVQKDDPTKDEKYQHTLSRLIQQIIKLIDRVEKIHLALPEEKRAETITRLICTEFSFYTRYKPLSLEEYKEIAAALSERASKLPEHIIFVLSTFPVLWPDKRIHNACLHIQSPRKGKEPLIHHIDKQHPHGSDNRYGTNGGVYRLYNKQSKTIDHVLYSPDIVLADSKIKTKDINQKRGALVLKVSPKERVFSVTEICLDHLGEVGINDLLQLILQLEANEKPVPKLGTHVLTSNSIYLHKTNITARVTHADTKIIQKKLIQKRTHLKGTPLFGSKMPLFILREREIKPLRQQNINRVKIFNRMPSPNPAPQIQTNPPQKNNQYPQDFFKPTTTTKVITPTAEKLKKAYENRRSGKNSNKTLIV